MENQNTYLVGGAVRDKILGIEPKDKDYVVVGSNISDMIARGFHPIQATFPVFIHPVTKEQYALARTEQSTGNGYNDFVLNFDDSVTLTEDLSRRDLTINAIAEDLSGNIIDPLGGKKDIKNKIFRHCSDAFRDDPVRVLRLARFASVFGPDWSVADETVCLCHNMVKDGMLKSLTGERVFLELIKAFQSDYPRLFFDTLHHLGGLEDVFPEIHKMRSVVENLKWHPEGNTYEHVMLVLTAAKKSRSNPSQMYAALVHDFGKTLTPTEDYPKHYGHEKSGIALVKEFGSRVRIPRVWNKKAKILTEFHMHMHKFEIMRSTKIVKMFDSMGAWNNPSIVKDLIILGIADARGKLGNEDADDSPLWVLLDWFNEANKVTFENVMENSRKKIYSGEAIKHKMFQARSARLDYIRQYNKIPKLNNGIE